MKDSYARASSISHSYHSQHANFDLPAVIRPPRYNWTREILNSGDHPISNPQNSSNYSGHYIPTPRNKKLIPYDCSRHPPRRDLCHSSNPSNSYSSRVYDIFESPSLQHWFKNWQESRKHKLTASTFAGAVGLWEGRRVQLWLEKLGKVKPFTGNLSTAYSNHMEGDALARYKLITGNNVSFPEFQIYGKTNPEDNWLAASPDGLIEYDTYGLSSGGVLEIKCPLCNGEVGMTFPWSRIPLHCMPQAQGLMEILDRNWMEFYVWTPNGSSLFRLQRDRQYWELLKVALSDFWWKHVQPAKELCRTRLIMDPITELRSLKPEPRHELFREIIYGSKCLVDDSELLVREIHGKLQN